MLSFSPNQRFFLYRTVTDMRKGFDGLSGLVRSQMKHDLLSGDVFIFVNKRRDWIKLLMWDRTGFALYYKQLERCLLYTSPSPRDRTRSRMPSSA